MRQIDCLCNNPDVLATLLVQLSFGDGFTVKYHTPIGIYESFTEAIEQTKMWLLSDVREKTNG